MDRGPRWEAGSLPWPLQIPKYLLIRPVINYPVGAYDLDKKQIVYSARMSATDVWGEEFVSERFER